jgi:hypothetical protein
VQDVETAVPRDRVAHSFDAPGSGVVACTAPLPPAASISATTLAAALAQVATTDEPSGASSPAVARPMFRRRR